MSQEYEQCSPWWALFVVYSVFLSCDIVFNLRALKFYLGNEHRQQKEMRNLRKEVFTRSLKIWHLRVLFRSIIYIKHDVEILFTVYIAV